MGLIHEQDRRPRDWAYRVAFDRKDLPSLEQMIQHIRETHDTDMIEDFNSKCEQKLMGESVQLHNGLEIQQVTKTEDLVVNVGLQLCINLILATANEGWGRFAFTKNSSLYPVSVTNTALNNSVAGPWYVSINPNGWSEPKGMKMFFGVITPQDASDQTRNVVDEMGIVSPSNILLNREAFYPNAISRSITPDGQMYKQVFIFSCVIEFCPMADLISGIPTAPTGLAANSIFASGATLNCNIVNVSPSVTSYKFYYSTSPTFSGGFIVTASSPTVNIGSLTPETVYYVKCSAVNSLGEGAFSSTISFTTSILPMLELHLDGTFVDTSPNAFQAFWFSFAGTNGFTTGQFGSSVQFNTPITPGGAVKDGIFFEHTGAPQLLMNTSIGFSFSGWVYPVDLTAVVGWRRFILENTDDPNNNWSLSIDPAGILYFLVTKAGTTYKRQVSGFTLNSWQHIGAVFNGATNTLEVYRNGVAGVSSTIADVGTIATQGRIYIGGRINDNSNTYYEGRLDELRYYQIVLTPTQINNLKNTNDI